MLEDMKLGKRLGVGFCVLVAGLAITIGAGVLVGKSVKAKIETIVTGNHVKVNLAQDAGLSADR